ncbi:MAG: hypothetical protein AAF337_09475, partial [Pseudomonadota bacterium]
MTHLIDWTYAGKPDGFFGTGATLSEKALACGAGAIVTVLIGFSVITQDLVNAWSVSFWVLIILAFDVAGGVTANMLNSAKRYYHAPLHQAETGFHALTKNHFAFALIHVHPILAAWAMGGDVIHGLFWYGAMVIGAFAVRLSPLYLQRPV